MTWYYVVLYSSSLNNFNAQNCYEEFDLRQHTSELNISESPLDQRNVASKEEHPPPIPPKVGGSLNSSLDLGGK